MSLYKMISPYIFTLDPEKAHNLVAWALKNIAPMPLVQDFLAGRYCVVDEVLATEVCGLKFYNPVGLAAGFDKNATMIKGLSTLGFGFLELGTITQVPQEGNPKPRIFRYANEKSIQNAMGFNNHGSLEVAKRLKNLYPYSIPLGVNIGKNKAIAQSDSLQNYEAALLDLLEVGDYYVFNLSSPNTPNLRDLQNVSFVGELFAMARKHTNKPLFLKIAPDMDIDEMLKVVDKAIKSGANGIIATNTTIDYSVLEGARDTGGVSGAALKEKSKEVFKLLSQAFFGKTALISVGGIDSAQEAYERLKLGANLVQVYSGLIFEGPRLCQKINSGLAQLLRQEGFSSLQEAIGVDRDTLKPKRGRKKSLAEEAKKSQETLDSEISESGEKKAKRGRKPKATKANDEDSTKAATASKVKKDKALETKEKSKTKKDKPQKSRANKIETSKTEADKTKTRASKAETSTAENKAEKSKISKSKTPKSQKSKELQKLQDEPKALDSEVSESKPIESLDIQAKAEVTNTDTQDKALSVPTMLDTESKPTSQS